MQAPRAAILWSFALIVASAAGPAAAKVWTVDPGSGVTLSSILGDMTLADGDVIKIPAMPYNLTSSETWALTTISKKISLLGDGPGRTVLSVSDGASFIKSTTDIRVAGMTLSGFGEAINISTASSSDHVTVDLHDLEITDGVQGIVWDSNGAGSIASLVIAGCRIHDLMSLAIKVHPPHLQRARVVDNEIHDVVGKGIWLGLDAPVSDTAVQQFVVTGNSIRGVRSESETATQFGIVLYGEEATVSNNVIEDVGGAAADGGDLYAGIYTKCRRSVITDNILRNVGPGYPIDVKGKDRSPNPTQAQGYSTLVTNNQVTVTVSGAGLSWHGIKTANEDVSIHGNHVEVTGAAVVVETVAKDDISVVGNMIVGGWRGVDVRDTATSNGPNRYVMIANNHFVDYQNNGSDRDIVYNNGVYPPTGYSTGLPGWVVTDNIRHP